VRIGALEDSSLVARKVGAVRRVFVASPAYLRRHGVPRTPAALRGHAVIAFSGLLRDGDWRFVENGRFTRVAVAPRLEINDAPAAIEAAERGEGIVNALSYQVARAIRAGRLAPVLRNFAPPSVPVSLVYPQSRLVAAKLRAFVDFAAPRLAKALADLVPPGGLGDQAAAPVDERSAGAG
jgi:DNA-binding transcriptional LysR family regulator